jgi:hypothetical protein
MRREVTWSQFCFCRSFNYGKSSITVKHTQHTMSVHYIRSYVVVSLYFIFSELKCEAIVRCVDIVEIAYHHCLNFLFITTMVSPSFMRGQIFFCVKKHTLIPPKSSLKLISSKWLSFWLTTHLVCLMIHVFFQHTDRSYRDPLISLSAI